MSTKPISIKPSSARCASADSTIERSQASRAVNANTSNPNYSSSDTSACTLIAIERIVVAVGRLRVDVRLASGVPRYSSPALARRVCADFPQLPQHTCVNERAPRFAAVMADTSLPHLLEHLVIDLQVRSCEDEQTLFTGSSEWLDEQAGLARIEVSFTDDLVALRAFRDATRYLGNCVLG